MKRLSEQAEPKGGQKALTSEHLRAMRPASERGRVWWGPNV